MPGEGGAAGELALELGKWALERAREADRERAAHDRAIDKYNADRERILERQSRRDQKEFDRITKHFGLVASGVDIGELNRDVPPAEPSGAGFPFDEADVARILERVLDAYSGMVDVATVSAVGRPFALTYLAALTHDLNDPKVSMAVVLGSFLILVDAIAHPEPS